MCPLKRGNSRSALKRGIEVVLVHDAHGTYNLDDIPSSIVSRVAEHALGDEIELGNAASVTFSWSAGRDTGDGNVKR
jgi:hypothetical protein